MSKQYATDESKGRYFHVMLNMADDDLTPYQYRLLGHYIRVDGCWESVRTSAKTTRMSIGMLVKTRNELQDMGYISIELSEHDTYFITVIDRMEENVARYLALAAQKKQRSSGEHAKRDVHGVNTDVHEVNNRKFKRVHEVKQRITNQEEQKEEEQKEIAPASASAPVPPIDLPSNGRSTKTPAPSTKKGKANAKDTTPSTPRSARPPSPHYEAMVALGEAFGVMFVEGDKSIYGAQVKKLIASGITPDQFPAYVEYWRARAANENWRLTVTSLTGPGRMSEFVAHRTRQAEMMKFARPLPPEPDPSEWLTKAQHAAKMAEMGLSDLETELKNIYGVDS